MEPEGSLPRLQSPATGLYPEPDACSPHFFPYFPKTHSNIIIPSTPRSSEWLLPFRFLGQIFRMNFSSPMRATCLPTLTFSISSQ